MAEIYPQILARRPKFVKADSVSKKSLPYGTRPRIGYLKKRDARCDRETGCTDKRAVQGIKFKVKQ